jgi:hypothetical protein
VPVDLKIQENWQRFETLSNSLGDTGKDKSVFLHQRVSDNVKRLLHILYLLQGVRKNRYKRKLNFLNIKSANEM